MPTVFVTGGTGYLGRPLVEALLADGADVHTLVRAGSQHKLPAGAIAHLGDALDAASFAHLIPADATLVHLVGTPHPNPSKAAEFRRVDLASIQASIAAAGVAGVRHLVYVSVAHPAPVMQAYIAVREEAETLIANSGIPATVLRPWYVLGPGHRWPWVLLPLYALLRILPATRAGALRLGLVSRRQMIAALCTAIDAAPANGVRVVDVEDIRRASKQERHFPDAN